MKKKLFSFLLIPLLLTGCSNAIKLQFVPLSTFATEQDLMRDYEDEYFYSRKETTPISYQEDKSINNLRDLLLVSESGHERRNIPAKGERKLLVVPVYFTDSDTTTHKDKTIFIQNAFFGETNHTNYDSVAGYYNKSSYGQLRITGEVAPWYNTNKSSKEWEALSHTTASSIIASEAVDYIKENNLMDLSQYDTDGDDNIDGVYIIYDHPQKGKSSANNLFWAFTYYTYKGENGRNKEAPYLNGYSWTSINSILQKDNRSYTNYLIHETGHLFGLSDYYNTFTSTRSDCHYQPTGCFDMMDYNIGDHSSLSKYLLNWTSPLVVKSGIDATIELKPFITSGEYLLVPSSKYNNSPFSEYLLIEYFTPTGLNSYNGKYSYDTRDGGTGVYSYPQYHGLKIYHVNAALGYYQVGGSYSPLICTLDDPDYASKISGKTVGVNYAYPNSINDQEAASSDAKVMYHLLESSGNNTFLNGTPANNDTLFRYGDDFGINTFKDYKFSNGEAVDFTLKVNKISTKSITITIHKG